MMLVLMMLVLMMRKRLRLEAWIGETRLPAHVAAVMVAFAHWCRPSVVSVRKAIVTGESLESQSKPNGGAPGLVDPGAPPLLRALVRG